MAEVFFSCPFCRRVQKKADDTRQVVIDGVMRLACGSHFEASSQDSVPSAKRNGDAGNGVAP